MTGQLAATTTEEIPVSGHAGHRYIRGSSLLVAGRLISIFLNFVVQVVTVRYLSKGDFGVFAYALAVVALGSSAVQLGLDKSIPRLIPIYYERGEYPRIFGAIALATGAIWGLSISLVALLYGLQSILGTAVVSDPRSLSLLVIMIALSPVGAYTCVLERLVAIFASPQAIFFRRHILAPGLKLAAVVVVVLSSGGVYLLACGYLLGGLLGVVVYVAILWRQWRSRGLLSHARPSRLAWPARELFGFSLPLMSTDLLMILRTSFVVIVLERFHNTAAVAEYRAVFPVAALNMLAFEAFLNLFVPLASRMFARRQLDEINRLYWTTSAWIAVLTFPVFALTCALAEPLTVLLFGPKYAGAGTLLSILAVGHYVHAALGFNAASLRVHGKLHLIVATDMVSAVFAIALSLLLIPRYGAVGAAISTAATLVLYNAFAQLSLRLGDTGIDVLERPFAGVFGMAALLVGTLLIVQHLWSPSVYVGVALVGVASLIVVRLTRRTINPEKSFPELLRIPFVRQLVAPRPVRRSRSHAGSTRPAADERPSRHPAGGSSVT
jgi:O-antigen/teichoic acid export membrane protein